MKITSEYFLRLSRKKIREYFLSSKNSGGVEHRIELFNAWIALRKIGWSYWMSSRFLLQMQVSKCILRRILHTTMLTIAVILRWWERRDTFNYSICVGRWWRWRWWWRRRRWRRGWAGSTRWFTSTSKFHRQSASFFGGSDSEVSVNCLFIKRC